VRRAAPVVVAALAAGLAGCDMFTPRETPTTLCPRGLILNDAQELTQFREGIGRDLTDVVSTVRVADVTLGCKYDTAGMSVEMQVAIAAERGPADRAGFAEAEYFVALVDGKRQIRAREVYRLRFEFVDNRNRIGRIELLDPFVPQADATTGPDWQIWVGLQLTPQQVEDNKMRRGR